MAPLSFLVPLFLALSRVSAVVEFVTIPISLEGQVAGDEEYRLKFPLDSQTIESRSLLVTSKLLETAPFEPGRHRRISVAVRHSSGQSQWDLDSEESTVASEIICLPERQPGVDSENVTVIVSTYHDEASKSPARFELNVEMVDNFVTSDDDDDGAWSATETISRGASRVWIFKPKPGKIPEMVTVLANSEDDVCGLVAVQPLRCPFADSPSEARYNGRWQTVMRTAVIDVRLTEARFSRGFYVVAMMDNSCGGPDSDPKGVSKEMRVMVKPMEHDIGLSVVAVLLFYVLLPVFVLGLALCFQMPVEGMMVKRIKDVSRQATRSTNKKESAATIVALGMAAVEMTERGNNTNDGVDTSDTELNKDEKVSPGNVPQLRVETAEETRGATLEVDTVDGAAVSRCRSLSFKEPTLPVQISESEGGNKITLITSAKEVREVIYNVVRVANANSGDLRGQSNGQDAVNKRNRRKSTIAGGMGRTFDKTLQIMDDDGNDRNDPRAFAGGCIPVEIYKEHMANIREQSRRERMNDEVTLNHLSVTVDTTLFPDTLKMKSSLYVWIIFLTGIFYTLPVLQMIAEHQSTSNSTGNLDLCYYNYLCKVSAISLEDFGHVFSNVSYILSGVIFVVIAFVRSSRYKKLLKRRTKFADYSERRRGIPEQYGIFYALGVALIMEGVLSGCYHICPTKVNFQFDTTFMYVISVLLFLKVYQFRHPDITYSAYNVFTMIGSALSLEVLSYYVDFVVFWPLFLICFTVVLACFSINTYYNGMYSMFSDSVKNMFRSVRRDGDLRALRPQRRNKFVLTVTVIAVNCALAVVFSVKRGGRGISRYLLFIFIANMGIYVVYYIVMKCYLSQRLGVRSESMNKLSLIYFACSVIFLASGCLFFVKELKSSARSPAASRNLNAPCAILIFDNHDLWHFFSAVGLFFMFLMVLTIEDHNMETSWDQIRVF